MFNRETILAEIAKGDRVLFKEVSDHYIYNAIGAEEAFRYIDAHPELPTIDALGEFIRKMDYYSCAAKTDNSSFMFSTVKDIAEYILDCYISEVIGGIK